MGDPLSLIREGKQLDWEAGGSDKGVDSNFGRNKSVDRGCLAPFGVNISTAPFLE